MTDHARAIEAGARAIYESWANYPACDDSKPWDVICEKRAQQADDFRRKAKACIEAATALDELQGEISQWANEVARYKAYAEKFDEENAALQARVEELEQRTPEALAKENASLKNWIDLHRGDVMSLSNEVDHFRSELEAAESRATSAEQQRDEAYERLKPFAEAADDIEDDVSNKTDIWEAPCAMQITVSHLRAARDLVRRLAAGTEKEGK